MNATYTYNNKARFCARLMTFRVREIVVYLGQIFVFFAADQRKRVKEKEEKNHLPQ